MSWKIVRAAQWRDLGASLAGSWDWHCLRSEQPRLRSEVAQALGFGFEVPTQELRDLLMLHKLANLNSATFNRSELTFRTIIEDELDTAP